MIGDDIEIVVVDIKGDQVKLGIRAPRNVAIHRTEIYQEIQDQNKEAAQSVSPDKLRDLQKLLGKEKKKDEEFVVPAYFVKDVTRSHQCLNYLDEFNCMEFNIGDIVRSGFVRNYLIQKTKLGMGIE